MKVNFLLLIIVVSLGAKTKLDVVAGAQMTTNLKYFDSAAGYADGDVISISLTYRTNLLLDLTVWPLEG